MTRDDLSRHQRCRGTSYVWNMFSFSLWMSASRQFSVAVTKSVPSYKAFKSHPVGFAIQPHIQSSYQRTPSYCTSAVKYSVDSSDVTEDPRGQDDEDEGKFIPPWSLPINRTSNSKAFARFRQHVNPLARRYQMSTDLPENWPLCDFTNVNLPLYLDIGCGKGGFLLELVGRMHGNRGRSCNPGEDAYQMASKEMEDTTANWLPNEMNYLGLEIRPGVSQYAQARVEKRGLSGKLSFVGCNANVDLDRLLTLYQEAAGSEEDNNRLAFVSIQFPDPHFKKAHSKRRVVTSELVSTLAKFMRRGDVVFLQSDIKDALEAMREKFVEDSGKLYFDELQGANKIMDGQEKEYGMENPLGIPTEREVSVLNKGLPVFRTMFRRNEFSVL
ncbi:hypothetical protein HJC23_011196 [Cyclotella cryptica]|uniref:tRNA (guanine(46)-N(7))-methyltransferase n=1 Tax=Cyclotella cryptica TaxID=29204 RepID=A0ABD3PXD9_9STRA|eukprot:CCRYP_011012-RA/>CCRYP_011012-RA protein AED:0.12 eAED:0.11 QI:0/-1/0/1/-1/1/1/0/384